MADGSVTIEVTLTKEQLEKGLKSIKKDLNELAGAKIGAGISKVGQAITNIGNSMANTGKKIAVATAGIVAGLGTAVGRFDTLKNYPKVLSNLGISAEDAEKSIKQLSDGIDGLPTALDDAASGVQRIVAKNGDIKKSTKYFLAMNNAIIAGNAPTLDQANAIEQLTQAYTKGKFDFKEWLALSQAMPGQLKQISNAMGYINTDDLYEALQKGTVSMDNFMDTVAELNENGVNGFQSFEQQAKNSTNSIGTAIKNLGNRIKKGFATILEGLDEMAKDTPFESLAGMINQFSTSIKNFLDKVGSSLKNNKEVQKTFTQLAQTLTKIQDTINNLSPEQIDSIITAFVKLAKAGPGLILVGKGLSFFGKTLSGIGNAVSLYSKLSTSISSLSATATAGSSGTSLLSKAFSVLTGKVGIVLGIIGAVIAALTVLYNKSESFRNIVSKVIEGIKNALSKAWETIKPAFEKLGEALKKLWEAFEKLIVALEPILSPALAFIGSALEKIIEVLGILIGIITEIVTIIVNVATKIIEIVTNIVTAIINFFTTTIPNAFNSFVDVVKKFVDSVIDWFKNLPYNIGVFIGQVIGHIVQFGIDAWNWVTTELPKIIQGIIEWFKQLPSKIWDWLVDTVNKVIQWGQDMAIKAKEGAVNTFNNIVETIKSLPSKMLEIGKNIVQGLWQGIQNAWSWLVNKVKEFAKGILDGMMSALGIHSPSTLFRDKVGKNIALGVGEGFEDNISKVYRQMKSAVDFETQRLSANLSTTATMSKVFTANINVNGNVEMDGNKVGRLVTPVVSRTLRTAGA